ncbi:hypothetical protein AHAS_Ahas05G0052100 [Arachis hypogaea]
MEYTHQSLWIIPFIPLPVPMLIGAGLLFFPTATKNLRRRWAFLSILLLGIVMLFSVALSIDQINNNKSFIYQYVWSWTINNDLSLEFGYLIDSLTLIMLILITTVGILVLIYSDNYMSHDQGYLRFFAYMSFFNASMLGLVTSFWFTRPIAANACQKAFVTNRLYWITVKSAQFPLHVWLSDAMEGPTPISALIHAATMVAAGIFLVARLLPLFIAIPTIMNGIAFIGIITLFLGATLAIAQKDIKRNLAYSTMSQLGYMMLALGMGSSRAALFHLITHAYSKALLFLGSGSIIHSMETIVGYSPEKSQNMVLMGGLTKHTPITKTAFLIGTLSLCGIPPFACFWSKDLILNDSWLYSPIFAILAYFTAGLTAFYMFRIYLLVFEGYFNVHFQNLNGKKKNSLYSISLWGKERKQKVNKRFYLIDLLTLINNDQKYLFFNKRAYFHRINQNVKSITRLLIDTTHFDTKKPSPFYPHESTNTMLFSMFILVLFTLLVGVIGISFSQEGTNLDILSKLLIPSIDLLHQNFQNSFDWFEFLTNATFSVSLSFFGIFIASFIYKPVYSVLQNLNLKNIFEKNVRKTKILEKIINAIYDWSSNRGYLDAFYGSFFITNVRKFAKINHYIDRQVIDAIPNGIGILSFFMGEAIKYIGGGRISSYIYILLSFLFILLVICSLFLFVY